MKIAAIGLMVVGVLLAAYGFFALYFINGDWLEIGLGAAGVIIAGAGVVLMRVASQATPAK